MLWAGIGLEEIHWPCHRTTPLPAIYIALWPEVRTQQAIQILGPGYCATRATRRFATARSPRREARGSKVSQVESLREQKTCDGKANLVWYRKGSCSGGDLFFPCQALLLRRRQLLTLVTVSASPPAIPCLILKMHMVIAQLNRRRQTRSRHRGTHRRTSRILGPTLQGLPTP